jgi:hypothetical protein
LPELMELRKGGQTLIGFPALIDKGAHVQLRGVAEVHGAIRQLDGITQQNASMVEQLARVHPDADACALPRPVDHPRPPRA